MKGKKERIAALALALVMTVGILAGCGGKDENAVKSGEKEAAATVAASSQASTQETDKYAPKDGKKYEISYVTITSAPVGEDSVVAKKFDELFNVTLKPVFIDSSKWDDLMNMKLASGDIPDVFPSNSPDRFARYIDQDLLQEIPMDTLNTYAKDLVGAINSDDSSLWSLCSMNGKNYGIPLISGDYVFRDPIVWRTDWLANVGISKIPDTIQEWEEALVKFRNNDPDKNGKKDTYGCSLTSLIPVFGAYGSMINVIGSTTWNGFWMEKDGKIVYSGIEPGTKDALALLNKWYKSELMYPEFITGENKGGYWAVSTDFVNGKIGVSAHGNPFHWQKEGKGLISGPNEKELKKINPNATFDYSRPPVGPDGKTRGMSKYSLCTGVTYVVSKKVEPDKLGKILQMFNWPAESFDNFLFNWLGEKDKHYEVTEADGYKTYSYKEPYKSDRAKRYSEVGAASFFWEYNVGNARQVQAGFFDNFSKLGFDKDGVVDLYYMLNMPSYAKYSTDLNKMLTEAYVGIITGSKPVSYFDEFVAKWKANGGDQLLKEANEYYSKVKSK